ncbi:MAG: type II toxin-antitoxin system VapC family toxin [Candidatus Contendobacter sp.]|nr:type II toxin-antitoxin system VapC family toxin [Candidatus Contendobacter sp.]
MRIIINDASALIDLAKTRLLESLLRLPYRFVIPDVLYADELINLRHYQREQLLDIGFVLGELDGLQVGKASAYSQQHPQLSLNDCFALVMAETTENAVLLTGDQRLRRVAEQQGVAVHGILWILDQAYEQGAVEAATLHAALLVLARDPLTRLPGKELQRRIQDFFLKLHAESGL